MCVLLVVGMLSIAVGGASAAGWLAPDNVPLAFNDLGFDEHGNGIAVGVGTDSGGNTTIRATTRPFGGRWGDSVAISRNGDSDVSDPQIAVNSRGDAVAIWSGYDDATSKYVVRVANRPADGAWSDPVIVSDGAVFNNEHDVVIDEQGHATAIWDEIMNSTTFFVRTASRLNGSNWSPAVDLSDSSHGRINMLPQLAVDAQGNAIAVWVGDGTGTGVSTIIQSKTREGPGGAWSSQAVDLTDSGQAQAPQIVIDRQGNATAVWESFDVNNGYVAHAARRAAGGGWTTPVDLGAGGAPKVAVNAQGDATAVWTTSTMPGSSVRTSTSAAGGPWSNPVELAAGPEVNSVGSPWVAVDSQGTVTAIWGRFNSGSVIAQASRRAPGSDWSATVDLAVGPINAIPAAGIDPEGYVTMAWSLSAPPLSGSSTVFDFVAPELRDPATPAKAVVGQSVGMSVDSYDAWSSVTTSWDFGDGQSASGATVHHTYSSPGVRTVTITGVDSVGNTTKTTQKITVDSASENPGPGPGPGPAPGPAPAPAPGPKPGPAPALTAPVLSALKQSGSRWRTHTVKRGPRLPVGSTFRFTLDRAAQVRFAFSQIVAGRRVNGRCVTLTKANLKKSRCDRSQTVGTLSITGKAGSNAYTFRGKLRGHTLKPGRYRVLVTAVANGKTSAAKSMQFTIVG